MCIEVKTTSTVEDCFSRAPVEMSCSGRESRYRSKNDLNSTRPAKFRYQLSLNQSRRALEPGVLTDSSDSPRYFEDKEQSDEYGDAARDDVGDIPIVAAVYALYPALDVYPYRRILLKGRYIVIGGMQVGGRVLREL